MVVSPLLKKEGCVGNSVCVTVQFYQINTGSGEPRIFHRQGHLNQGIPIGKDQRVGVADVDKLLGRCEPNLDVERCPSCERYNAAPKPGVISA